MEFFLVVALKTIALFAVLGVAHAVFDLENDDDDDGGGGTLQPVYVPNR